VNANKKYIFQLMVMLYCAAACEKLNPARLICLYRVVIVLLMVGEIPGNIRNTVNGKFCKIYRDRHCLKFSLVIQMVQNARWRQNNGKTRVRGATEFGRYGGNRYKLSKARKLGG
jgi:hypothetical protein